MTTMAVAMIGLAYLLGSIPTGFILGAWAGVDVRKSGSGNVGATNVARVLGKRQGICTLIADIGKGWVPVFIALQLGFTITVAAFVGVAAFLGHLFPVFLGFKGGKGVATALGVFVALAPLVTVILIVLFAVVMWVGRTVSLSSMIAAAAAPIVFWCFSYAAVLIAASAFLAGMIILRHRSNIQRLLAGTEPKFGA
ncbi:MAG: glycerol-3-phosphate 1-O-acyltransferase PlsY [Deltaproteobacteria bacterium]|jgi:acyl phosphate:glycerol-3-phosphate acyltransferase